MRCSTWRPLVILIPLLVKYSIGRKVLWHLLAAQILHSGLVLRGSLGTFAQRIGDAIRNLSETGTGSCLARYVASNRRDARCVPENSDPQSIQKEFSQLDTKSIRNKFHVPEIRALALGSFWSPVARSMATHYARYFARWQITPFLSRNRCASLSQFLCWGGGWDGLHNPWRNHVCKTIRSIWDLRHDKSNENHPRDDGIGYRHSLGTQKLSLFLLKSCIGFPAALLCAWSNPRLLRGYSGCVSKFWPKDFITKDYIPKVPPHYELVATSRAPALQRSTWALLLQLAERKGHCTRGRRVLLLSELHKGTCYNAFPTIGYTTGHNTGSAR